MASRPSIYPDLYKVEVKCHFCSYTIKMLGTEMARAEWQDVDSVHEHMRSRIGQHMTTARKHKPQTDEDSRIMWEIAKDLDVVWILRSGEKVKPRVGLAILHEYQAKVQIMRSQLVTPPRLPKETYEAVAASQSSTAQETQTRPSTARETQTQSSMAQETQTEIVASTGSSAQKTKMVKIKKKRKVPSKRAVKTAKKLAPAPSQRPDAVWDDEQTEKWAEEDVDEDTSYVEGLIPTGSNRFNQLSKSQRDDLTRFALMVAKEDDPRMLRACMEVVERRAKDL